MQPLAPARKSAIPCERPRRLRLAVSRPRNGGFLAAAPGPRAGLDGPRRGFPALRLVGVAGSSDAGRFIADSCDLGPALFPGCKGEGFAHVLTRSLRFALSCGLWACPGSRVAAGFRGRTAMELTGASHSHHSKGRDAMKATANHASAQKSSRASGFLGFGVDGLAIGSEGVHGNVC